MKGRLTANTPGFKLIAFYQNAHRYTLHVVGTNTTIPTPVLETNRTSGEGKMTF
jgi:hypothetical protein